MSAGYFPESVCLCLSFSQTHTPPSHIVQAADVGTPEGPNQSDRRREEKMNEEDREL